MTGTKGWEILQCKNFFAILIIKNNGFSYLPPIVSTYGRDSEWSVLSYSELFSSMCLEAPNPTAAVGLKAEDAENRGKWRSVFYTADPVLVVRSIISLTVWWENLWEEEEKSVKKGKFVEKDFFWYFVFSFFINSLFYVCEFFVQRENQNFCIKDWTSFSQIEIIFCFWTITKNFMERLKGSPHWYTFYKKAKKLHAS